MHPNGHHPPPTHASSVPAARVYAEKRSGLDTEAGPFPHRAMTSVYLSSPRPGIPDVFPECA